MESKPKKPSLPRITTNIANIPPDEEGRYSVFARTPPDQSPTVKPERTARVPSLFPDENVAPGARYTSGYKTAHVKESSEEVPASKKPEKKSDYYEEAFSSRGSHNSPKGRVLQDSVVIAELITSSKVRHGKGLFLLYLPTYHFFRSKITGI